MPPSALAIEPFAHQILALGGQADEDAPDVGALVRKVLGGDAYYAPPGAGLFGGAVTVRVGDGWELVVGRDVPPRRVAIVSATALVRHQAYVEKVLLSETDIERTAAAVVLPIRGFRRALLRHGRQLSAIADEYGVQEALVALREADVLGLRRAVVTADGVRWRGDWSPPPESVLRLWAAVGGPGVRRAHLSDGASVVIDIGA